MKVVLIFPVTHNEKNTPIIMENFQKKLAPELIKLGAIQLEIKLPGSDYAYVGVGQDLQGKPKGRGILDCLQNVRNPDYVIVCDGSLKIPTDYTIDIFQQLISDANMHCVMANRCGNTAISPFRYLIERFEIFVLKKHFNCDKEIPDGQCGLWGYQSGKIEEGGSEKEIKLTAVGYEIELDLVSEVLVNNLQFSFIDVKLPEAKVVTTAFTYDNNLLKMRFLLDKHKELKQFLPKYIPTFEEKKEIEEEFGEDWKKYKLDILKLN